MCFTALPSLIRSNSAPPIICFSYTGFLVLYVLPFITFVEFVNPVSTFPVFLSFNVAFCFLFSKLVRPVTLPSLATVKYCFSVFNTYPSGAFFSKK